MAKQEQESPLFSAVELLSDDKQPKNEQPKESLLQKVGKLSDLAGTVKDVGNSFTEFYSHWIKPIYDNRMQITRRLNLLSIIYSIVFFILYVPFLLFGKIADGLSMGREIALYACLGAYGVALIVFLIVYLTTGKNPSTKSSERYKRAMKIFLYCVRIASVAISITALVLTSTSTSELSTAVTTFSTVFAIISIVFSALPLVFGSFKGFINWLISPAVIKQKFSEVAIEWFSAKKEELSVRKKNSAAQKELLAYANSLDQHVLPALGNTYVKSVTSEQIENFLNQLEGRDRDIAAIVLKNICEYAINCGSIEEDPCKDLDIPEVIPEEKEPEKQGVLNKLFGRMSRKKKDSNDD